jgi:hypothetical protein
MKFEQLNDNLLLRIYMKINLTKKFMDDWMNDMKMSSYEMTMKLKSRAGVNTSVIRD